MSVDVSLLNCLLFVPGDRPERFAKAEAAGAGAVILDLEDAVAPPAKDSAREAVVRHLSQRKAGRIAVRVNALTTRHGLADLLALIERPPEIVLLPKCEDVGELRIALGALGAAVALVAVIESARGLARCEDLATNGAAALGFGAFDLAADLRAAPEPGALAFARGRVVAASALARIGCLDVPDIDFRDLDSVRRNAMAARQHGFTGKFAIHPAQVAPIVAAFTPGEAEVDQARRVIAAFEAAAGGAVQLDGRMIDLPVIHAARRVLDQAGVRA